MNSSKNISQEFIRENRIKIGNALREIREKKGYSQDYLSEIMEVDRSTISKIENGKFNCSIDYLSKFSWFLKFDLSLSESERE